MTLFGFSDLLTETLQTQPRKVKNSNQLICNNLEA